LPNRLAFCGERFCHDFIAVVNKIIMKRVTPLYLCYEDTSFLLLAVPPPCFIKYLEFKRNVHGYFSNSPPLTDTLSVFLQNKKTINSFKFNYLFNGIGFALVFKKTLGYLP
jgi:hypothetical protein